MARITSNISSERGRGIITSCLILVVALVTALTAWKTLEVAYRFYDIRNQLAYMLGNADVEADLELRKKALSVAKRAGVVSDEQDIVVERSPGQVGIEMSYRHDIGLATSGRQLHLLALPLRVSVERRL